MESVDHLLKMGASVQMRITVAPALRGRRLESAFARGAEKIRTFPAAGGSSHGRRYHLDDREGNKLCICI